MAGRLEAERRRRLGSGVAALALIASAGAFGAVPSSAAHAGVASGPAQASAAADDDGTDLLDSAVERSFGDNDPKDDDDGDSSGSDDDPDDEDPDDSGSGDDDSSDDADDGDDNSGSEDDGSGDDDSDDDSSGSDDEDSDDSEGSGDDDDSGSGDDDDNSGSGSDDDDDDSGSGSDDDDEDDNSGSGSDDDDSDDDNSGSGSDDDDNSGSGSNDSDDGGDNSGSGSADDDNSGSGKSDDDDGDDDNSGHGSGDDNSNSGSSDSDDDGSDNSGHGNADDRDDDSGSDDNSGKGSDDDGDNSGSNASGDDDKSGDGANSSSGRGHDDADELQGADPLDVLQATEVDSDREGFRHRRGEVIAMDLEPADIEAAVELGFRVESEIPVPALGGAVWILKAPEDTDTDDAIDRLRAAAPRAAYAPNHLFFKPQAGPSARRAPGLAPRTQPCNCRIGMLDTGVAPVPLRGVSVRQRSFGAASVRPDGHGTAVASLMFDPRGDRSVLFVADVFGGATSSNGATSAIVRGLDWLASQGVSVINISLAGPPNPIVERAIAKLSQRGIIVVAAAGNDGPAAPPAYPAAYRGVLAVTAVDGDNSVYRYAGRGSHIDYAAIGVGVRAAGVDGSRTAVSGTSFAAPIVAARIARTYRQANPEEAGRIIRDVSARAHDLGAPGRDRVFGDGLVDPG